MIEKDLDIFDVWQSPCGNLFIKMSDNYSLAIGPEGQHEPNNTWGDLSRTQYVKKSDVVTVIKVGRVLFNQPIKAERKEKLKKIKNLNDEIEEWICE